ncbi:hypothetical protein BHM03_00062286 [Ensete ventricosum]|nr:hypothetical protein BHM03_00062286 [Ensete ventricosum]
MSLHIPRAPMKIPLMRMCMVLGSKAQMHPSQPYSGFVDLRQWTADARTRRGRFQKSRGTNPRPWPLNPRRSKGGPLPPRPSPRPPPDHALKPRPPSSGLLH